MRCLERRRGELDRCRARSEYDVSRTERTARAIVSRELDLTPREEATVALKARDSCRLEERDDALGHAANDTALALLHLCQIELGAGDLDAVRGKLLAQPMVELARLEQCLRRYAAGIEAGAAESRRAIAVFPLIYTGDAELVLCGAYSGRVTRRSRADDDHVERIGLRLRPLLVGAHDLSLLVIYA